MRAQGLPITTIVIAALAIIVLIVLAVMVVQRTTLFGRQMRNVSEQKCTSVGVPMPLGDPCDVIYGTFTDLRSDQVCCTRASVNQS